MLNAIRFVMQLFILCAVYWVGELTVQTLGLPIPGNVVGIVLLFFLLLTGVVKLEYVEVAAGYLLRHMLFFFIPLAVGLMNWGQLFYDNGLALALAIVVGAVLPFWLVGFLAQRLQGESK